MTPHQSSRPARSRGRKPRESSTTRGRGGVGWKTAGLLAAGLAALSLVGSADARWMPDYQDYQDWVPSSIAGVGEKVSSVGAQGLATLSDATARAKSSIFDSFDSWSAPPIADIDDTAASSWLDRHSSATEQAAESVKSWTAPPASDVCAKASSMLDQLSTVREQAASSFHSRVTSPVADRTGPAVSFAADQIASNIKSWFDSQIASFGTEMSALKEGLKSTTAQATSSFQSITAPFIANARAKASSVADGLFATVQAALEPSPPKPSKLTLWGLGEFISADFEADRHKMEGYTDVVSGQEQHFLFKQRSLVDRNTESMRLCQINPTDANTDGDKTVRLPHHTRPKQIAGPPSVAKTEQSVPSWRSAIISLWQGSAVVEPTPPLVRCTDAQSVASGLDNHYWKGRFLSDGENSAKHSGRAEFGPYTTDLLSEPSVRS